MFHAIFRGCCSWQKYACLLLLLPVSLQAQTIDLFDAIDKTIADYPLLQQRAAEVAAGKAHVITTHSNRLPSLLLHDQLTAGTANSLQGAYFPLSIVPSVSGSPAGQYSPIGGNVAVSFLQWEFFNFGYYSAQQKEAKARLAVSEANLGSDKYLLTQNVISLYLDWLKKYRLLQIETENMQRAEVIRNAIRAVVTGGLKPGVDSSTASAVFSATRISYLQAQAAYEQDKAELAAYIGLVNDAAIPDTALILPLLLQSATQLPVTDTVLPAHPLLQVYEQQYEQQLANVALTGKKYLPHISLDAAAWVRNSGISNSGAYPDGLAGGLPYSSANYLAGISVSYNVFDLKHRHDQLAETRYSAEAGHSALQLQQLNLNRMMQQANIAYAGTMAQLKELPLQLYAARQAYGQQVALYRAGLNTLVEVTNAQYALLQAETSYVLEQDQLLQLLYTRAGLSGQLDNFLHIFKH